MGIYYIADSQEYTHFFIYWGNYENNNRAGDGKWLGVNQSASYLFDGLWSDDKPNGQGIVRAWYPNLADKVLQRELQG